MLTAWCRAGAEGGMSIGGDGTNGNGAAGMKAETTDR